MTPVLVALTLRAALEVSVGLPASPDIPVGGSEISISIKASQADVLVGEPLKITVTWTAGDGPVKRLYVEDSEFLSQTLTFLVEDGLSKKTYRELPKGLAEHVSATVDLQPGESISRNLVLVRGSYASDGEGRPMRALLFPAQGTYAMQAIYSSSGRLATSNTVTLKVSEPAGAERDVFEAIRADAALIEATGPAPVQAKTKKLVETYPTSRYLRWTRIKLLGERAAALQNRLDPDTGAPLHLDKAGHARFKAQKYREMAEQSLHDSTWGPYEEEALAMAMSYAMAGGDRGMADQAKEELLRKHPNSAAAREVRAVETEEDDDKPPAPRPSPTPKP